MIGLFGGFSGHSIVVGQEVWEKWSVFSGHLIVVRREDKDDLR